MPSGWEIYYIVFLSAFVALGIPTFLALISYLISPQVKGRKKQSSQDEPNIALANSREPNHTEIGRKMNVRFFLAANAALILIALMLALVPCVGVLQPGSNHESLFRGLVAIVSISGFAVLGLLYSARKNDLSWLKSFQQDEGKKSE